MKKDYVNILIEEENQYFTTGLSALISDFFGAKGYDYRFINRCENSTEDPDIIFIGSTPACPVWLYNYFSKGYSPHVFFIKAKQRVSCGNDFFNRECGDGIIYRHHPVESVNSLLEKFLNEKNIKKKYHNFNCYCAGSFTKRDVRFLKYMAMGLNGGDTAEFLEVQKKTLNIYKNEVKRKLYIKSDQELYYWIKYGGMSLLEYKEKINS